MRDCLWRIWIGEFFLVSMGEAGEGGVGVGGRRRMSGGQGRGKDCDGWLTNAHRDDVVKVTIDRTSGVALQFSHEVFDF